ncbi:pentapeptide repeat-containing protein [Fodinibius sediminis]|uniref:Pentapeptide repeat-containing protein n=1 Tax=Fodinibius sediminis TaxID=1214077 RepID=A0A521F9V6_9BACT|nr:pentapeptide repeat-containing protein [Fodinibius sediminis]SMO92992.1 Pentapeptide repeat-containing protein [Fodinibius sediminis]
MFIEISQLQEYDSDEHEKVSERWNTKLGIKAQKHIENLINRGAGEDFLHYDVQSGILNGFLEHEWDLRGIILAQLEVECPKGDNFQGVDFSYSKFFNCHFEGCLFDATFLFTKFRNCKFENCTFSSALFKGSFIRNCEFKNIDFINCCRIDNCEIENTRFSGFFTKRNLFSNCKIYNSTEIEKPQEYPNGKWEDLKFNYQTLTDFYSELSLGFNETKALEKSSENRFLARKAYTNHNTKSEIKKWLRFLVNEKVAGYGEKPSFVLRASISLILLFAIFYLFSGFSVKGSSEIINYNIDLFGFWSQFNDLNFYTSLADNFLTSLYFSTKVFLIIGSDNLSLTSNWGTTWVIVESFLGITLISSWTALLLRKILR